jgi:alkanesulfonate monooxygenase SsuD/methylene tetrahydromethanopterin reductase-like flavin-dependent oxidoreductase (luciferase family)
MLIGFNAPTAGPLSAADNLAKIVVGAEAMGFDYATFSDHIVIPTAIAAEYPYSASGEFPSGTRGERHEQLTEIAWIAAKTTRLRLVTSVMVVPHRPAVLTAKILSTIDVLSGGRLTLGIGAGWMREEFEAIDAPDFDARGTVTDEYVRAFVELWTKDAPKFDGKHVRFAISVSTRSPCRSRIRRSGSEARAARHCGGPRASAMPGIRSGPTRRIRSIACRVSRPRRHA